MSECEKLAAIKRHADAHSSAHPAYHKHCHQNPDDQCADCQWLAELRDILERP